MIEMHPLNQQMTQQNVKTGPLQDPNHDDAGLLPGFDDPMTGSQSTFRSLLDALSHPGTVLTLDSDATRTAVPPGLSPVMTALLLTLVDSDTPLWLPDGIGHAVRQFVRFHCACPLTEDPAKARFVAVPKGFAPPSLADCHQGDPAYPDRSATLLIEVDALASGASGTSGELLTLRGPGIEHTQTLGVRGLPDGFWMQWRANHRHFPLGVDAFFCCETMLCGLPRTTHVEG